MKRVREYWEVNNLHFSNLTETDVNALGEFIAGIAVKDLKKLPKSVLHTAIKRLGEKFDLPEDKLRARAYLAIQFIKVALTFRKKLFIANVVSLFDNLIDSAEFSKSLTRCGKCFLKLS